MYSRQSQSGIPAGPPSSLPCHHQQSRVVSDYVWVLSSPGTTELKSSRCPEEVGHSYLRHLQSYRRTTREGLEEDLQEPRRGMVGRVIAASPHRTDRWTGMMAHLWRSRQCPRDEYLGKRDNRPAEHLEALGHVLCSSQPWRKSVHGAYG